MFVVEKGKCMKLGDISKVTWEKKIICVCSLSGVDTDQSMREPGVGREILVQGRTANFLVSVSKLLEIQRRNFSSSDLMISNDDLIYSDNERGVFSLKEKKVTSMVFSALSFG